MIIQNYLQKIGLTDKESAIYVAGLQLGPSSIQDLADEAGIKRTTAYEVVKSLKEKNLINESTKGKRAIFIMEEPDNIALFLKQREKVFATILPELIAIQNKDAKKPAIRIFEGQKGLEKIYDDMIKKPGEILSLAAPKDLISPRMLDFLRADWEPRRIKSGIPLRRVNINLSGDKRRDGKILPKPEEFEQIKYLPADDYPFTVGIYIYRKKVAFVSYQAQEMVGIVLRSPAVNLTMKAVFETFWRG